MARKLCDPMLVRVNEVGSEGSSMMDAHASAPTAPAPVRRAPVYFGSRGAWLFGWVHRGDAAHTHRRGVVICAPGGHEQLHAHRALRHLADALAAAGFPVMRFDLHGTGDSDGADDDPDRIATWLANLRSAAGWMRDSLGCAEVSVVGLRFGAALAARAAADEPLADLVLWAPVLKGRAYVREMKFLSKAAGVPLEKGAAIEAAGFVLSEQTAQDLTDIDLIQLRPQCRRALLVDRDDLPADPQLLEHLRGLGIEVQRTVQSGFANMVAEPHLGKVPHQAIAEIVSWFCRGEAGARAELPPEQAQPAAALVAGPGRELLRERALCICPRPNLFGILSEPVPDTTATVELPAIVLLNAGSAHHVGPNRLHVALARRLAAAGFRCLRMDLHGLGDSVTASSELENETYPPTAFRDVGLVMNFLKKEMGVGRMVLMGLCSGAYYAFQSAVQFDDPALLECVMINPLTFFWREGMVVETPQTMKLKIRQQIQSAALNGDPLSENSDDREHRCATEQPQRVRGASDTAAFPSHPATDDLAGDLVCAARTKRLLTFLFSRSDPGYDILTFSAKRLVDEMCATGQMRVGFIEGADHNFTRRVPREALLDAIVADLSGRYRGTATGGSAIGEANRG
jgi:alpha-beta hydrolase superfamily lysophospholipase